MWEIKTFEMASAITLSTYLVVTIKYIPRITTNVLNSAQQAVSFDAAQRELCTNPDAD